MKGIWKQTCVVLVFALVLLSIPAYPQAASNAVGVRAEFDKDSYVPGETATVSLQLTGLDDEMQTGLYLGSFETHLQFDPTQLAFSEGTFAQSLLSAAQGDAEPTVLLNLVESDRYPGVIVAALESPDGFLLDGLAQNGVLQVATLQFTVKDAAETDITVAFAPAYQTVVAKLPGPDAEFDIESETKDTAQVVPAKLFSPSASYDVGTITGSVSCTLPQGGSAVVLAALYNKTGTQCLQAAPQLFSVAADAGGAMTTVLEPSFTNVQNASDCQIRYYLWQATDTIKPMVPLVSADVTE